MEISASEVAGVLSDLQWIIILLYIDIIGISFFNMFKELLIFFFHFWIWEENEPILINKTIKHITYINKKKIPLEMLISHE